MPLPPYQVIDIPWQSEHSGQSSITLKTANGAQITCFSDGYNFKQGEYAHISHFTGLATTNDFDGIFQSNPNQEKSIESIQISTDWDYSCKGQVVRHSKDTVFVDCGGFEIEIPALTRDPSVVGCWVGFWIERLEVCIEENIH